MRALRPLCRRTLGVVADGDDGILGGWGRRLGSARDDEFAVLRADLSRKALAVLQGEVKGVGRLDGRDGVPLDRDRSNKFRLQEQVFPVARRDLPGQAVTIFQRDLVSKDTRSEKQKDRHTQQTTTH